MKSREFGTWPPRNGLGPDRQKLYDAYNRSFKKERPDQPKEYASSDVEEYYRIPETKDMSGDPYEQSGTVKTGPAEKIKKKRQARQNILRQAVGVLVGSVVIVSSYQAMAARQNTPEPPETVETGDVTDDTTNDPNNPNTDPNNQTAAYVPSFSWSDDKQTVVLTLSDESGNKVKEITAVVSVSETAATCNKEGTKTYTATAEDGDEKYTDTKSEPILPLGHAFDSGTEVTLENGQSGITFECTRCHERFTIQTSITEND